MPGPKEQGAVSFEPQQDTSAAPALSSNESPSDARSGSRWDAENGRLTVSDRVVEKIASQCMHEISGIGGQTSGFLGLGKQKDLSARPNVSVELTGSIASLRVELGIVYPQSIEESTQRVREKLIRRVSQLSGVRVAQVDIRVTYLAARNRREERVLL